MSDPRKACHPQYRTASDPLHHVTLGALLIRTVSRTGQYPVATIVGIILVYLASRAVALIPAEGFYWWYLRTGTGFCLGLLCLTTLIALGAMDESNNPDLLPDLRKAAVGSAAVGFATALPIIGLASFIPEPFWLPFHDAWAGWWVDVSIISLGSMCALSAGLDILIAWAASSRYGLSFFRSSQIAFQALRKNHLTQFKSRNVLIALGTVMSVIPYASLLVVPLVFHMAMTAFEAFDAVSRGTVEMGHDASYYHKGKVAAAQFFCSIPFGMNAAELDGWLYYGGGLELWRELYAPFNIVPFPCGNTGVQMGGWFNREINSPSDLEGLKMRIPGLGGEVIQRAGATHQGVAMLVFTAALYLVHSLRKIPM